MTFRWVVTGLVLALSAAAARAQTRPIFTSSVDLARLDLIVTDKDGRPIPDLRADEVQVIEGASPRPVLMLQRIAEAGRTYAESAQRTISSEVSTNQGAPRGQLYVLLFDQEHMTPGLDQKVRVAVERFLRDKVQPQDRVAMYGLPAPGPALAFTNNTRAALDQLQSVRGNLQRTVTAQYVEMTTQEAHGIMRGDDAVMMKFLTLGDGFTTSRAGATADIAQASAKRSGESQESLRRLIKDNAQSIVAQADGDSRRFLQLTADLLHSLRNIDGRKTVLLFSEGFYADNLASELRAVSAAAAESYSVIYAFDLNDRVASTADGEPGGGLTASDALNRTESIGGLSADTNGALITAAANRLDDALGAIGAPNNDYYIVAFETSAEAAGDRTSYRKIEVRVSRPGAVVRTRTGYTAGVNARINPAMPALRRVTIAAALAAPFGHQSLKVEYTTYQSHGAGGAERVILSLEAELPVAAQQAPGTRDEGPGTSSADVVFVVRNARTGQVAASGADQIALPSEPELGRSIGIGRWRVQFTLPPGEYLMRCIIREPGGLLGSTDRQFTVRALGGPDVAPSDLMLGRPGPELPVRTIGYTTAPLPGAVRVFGRTLDQLAKVSGRLELIPAGGTTAVVGVSAVPTEARDVDGQPLRDLFFDVPLAAVPPGEYVARAEIRSAGEFVSELRRQVTVVDKAPSASVEAATDKPASLTAAPSEAADSDIAKRITGAATSGVALLRSGKYNEAATALRAAFDADPTNPGVAFALGWSERGQHNMVAAVSAFRNAALLDPSMIPAHLALADTYLEMKQPALAIQALEAGLASRPNATELKRLLEMIKK